MNVKQLLSEVFGCNHDIEKIQRDAQRIQTKYNELVDDYNQQKKRLKELKENLKAKKKELDIHAEKTKELREQLAQQRRQQQSHEFKQIQDRFEKINRIAYKAKRSYENHKIPVYLDELITPDSYVVNELFKTARRYEDKKTFIEAVKETIIEDITWTSDKTISASGDYYQHPRETIIRKKGDCEDISYVAASADPAQIGMAWGYIAGNGHCYNVVELNDEIWVLDCSNETPHLKPINESPNYEAHWIITQRNHYKAKENPTRFGHIAEQIHQD